jgi:hypothetical protein
VRLRINMLWSCVLGLLALMALVAVIIALREFRRARAAQARLQSQRIELHNIYGRDPFPTAKNIESVRANTAIRQRDLNLLRQRMGHGQILASESLDPLGWMALLRRLQGELREAARSAQITVPDRFAFGFGRYDEGRPPKAADDVRRLTLQLRSVDALTRLLFACGIRELAAVSREEFEEASMIRLRTSTSPAPSEQGDRLFNKEHVVLGFHAKETSLVEVLNRLVASGMFIVVTGVRIEGKSGLVLGAEGKSGETPGLRHPAEAAAAAGGHPPTPAFDGRPRDERVVSGRSVESPALVTLDIDIYTFENVGGVR